MGVSCLCPGFVATNIFAADRNRPESLQDAPGEPASDEDRLGREALLEWMAANALQPAAVADMVHDAVTSGTFWIFTDEDHLIQIAERHERIRTRQEPNAKRISDDLFD